jgi:flagellar biosynthesis/type III secretory pathway protein FliH
LSAYDEGYRVGLRDGQWAGYRDLGKPVRHDFWRDGRYRQGTEGYRREYGSRFDYTEGYRSGYERGYRERRSGERRRE